MLPGPAADQCSVWARPGLQRIACHPGAGVVRHHAPALRRLVIDVGRQHESVARPVGGQHLDAFQHVVHALASDSTLRTRAGVAWIAPLPNICSKAARIAAAPTSRGPPGMHAEDLVLVGPAGHQRVDVAALQRLVEGGFHIVGGAAEGGGAEFGLGRHGRCICREYRDSALRGSVRTRPQPALRHRAQFALRRPPHQFGRRHVHARRRDRQRHVEQFGHLARRAPAARWPAP